MVKQRLKLASISPRLLDIYAEDGMTLDQLMAFTVSPGHERQKQVWEALQRSHNRETHFIRRLLTEDAVRASEISIDGFQRNASGARYVRTEDEQPVIESAVGDP